jgi:hypothetical protein
MPTMFVNTAAALTAAVGLTAASIAGVTKGAYDDTAVERLTRAEVASGAWNAFRLADRDGDKLLNVDEYAALAVVTSELAHLNGFISVEAGDKLKTISLPIAKNGAIGASEHVRIDAVARHTFYAFSGKDGRMDPDEYIQLQNAVFEASDLNSNGSLTKLELTYYAQRQAYLPTGV